MTPTLVTRDGSALPYSRSLMSQSLMAAGVGPARAWELAELVEGHLSGDAIGAGDLRSLVEQVLARQEGERALARYRAWRRLGERRRPLVVLLGGTAGTGKSTVATALAGRLGITRLTSTDMIRHILRTCFAEEVMPDVHVSSFEAGAVVGPLLGRGDDPDLLGFRVQAGHVGAAVRAIVGRAVAERTALIIEGVHLVPGVLPEQLRGAALVVHVLLTVEDEAAHRGHFAGRSGGERGPSARYLGRLDTIRKLQAHLLERARSAGLAVIDNQSVDRSVEAVLALVLDAVAAAAAQEEQPH